MSLYFTKRSIFDTRGITWCSEFLYREIKPITDENGYILPELKKFADDDTEAFFRENGHKLFKKGTSYIRFNAELLSKNICDILLKDRSVIEVTPEIIADKTALSKVMQLKKLGYTIAFSPFLYEDEHRELFKFANIVRFPIDSDSDAIKLTVEKCKEYGKPCIADGVETRDEFEYAQELGIDYISGYYFAKPVMETKRSGGPMIKTFLQILALLYSPVPDIEQIAAIISTDPVLTIRLLRLINQICAETGNTVSTIHQALVLLGLDKLKEWIYLVGLQRLNRDAPSELLRLALFRASFCENLGRITPGIGTRTKELYLMGLISIITGTSGKQLANLLSELPVSQEIKSGLMGGGGVFSNVFYLAYNYERGDWDKVDFFAKRCKIDSEAMYMIYSSAAHFVDGFSEINRA